MAPKKPAKHDAPATAGAATLAASAPTTVSPMGGPRLNATRATPALERARSKQPIGNYESPLKKLRTVMRNRRVIDTIQGAIH
jgi:hypothetical protein